MSRRGLTFGVAALLTVVLGILADVLPVPYVVFVPGPACDTLGVCYGKSVITVDPSANASPGGHLYLTTVGVLPASCDDHPTLLQALRAWWDHSESVEPHQVVCPPGQSSAAVQRDNEHEMAQSQRAAVTAALLHLGYQPTTEHVVVADVTPDAPAAKVLEIGDVLLAVDGQAVSTPDELRQQVSAKPVGTQLTLRIQRDTKTRDVQVTTVDSGDSTHRPVIGITPDIRATFKKPQVTLGLSPADVGGPSAGLMFTLGIIDKLTAGDLTGGRTVAGTGTINASGDVGPIGGIQEKIAAATRAPVQASVFLVPAADCADAKAAAPSSLTLVKVDTLQTALDGLQAITSGSSDFPRC